MDAFQTAIKLKPDYAEAYCFLGHTLNGHGKFADALTAFKRGHELSTRTPRWSYPSAEWVRLTERWIELDAKIPAILKGETKPANRAELFDLALTCKFKQLNAAAARFYQEAIADDPKRAEGPVRGLNYFAACVDALAGSGQGKDAETLDAKEQARLRRQALDWLREAT